MKAKIKAIGGVEGKEGEVKIVIDFDLHKNDGGGSGSIWLSPMGNGKSGEYARKALLAVGVPQSGDIEAAVGNVIDVERRERVDDKGQTRTEFQISGVAVSTPAKPSAVASALASIGFDRPVQNAPKRPQQDDGGDEGFLS